MTNAKHHPPPRLIGRDSGPVRLALAGLGKMGRIHLQAARRLGFGEAEDYYKADLPIQIRRLQVCAVCDKDAKKREYSPNLPFYEDWAALLHEQRPHMAIIATPAATHFELARMTLESRVHSLVEKPLATSLSDCMALMRIAESRGCRLMAGHVERYNPVAIKINDLIRSGCLSIRTYGFVRTQALPARIPDDIVTDKLIHDLDLALYFFGPVKNTEILSSRSAGGRIVELHVCLEHACGVRGTVFVSWLVKEKRAKRRHVTLQTAEGRTVEGDFVTKRLVVAGEPVECGVKGWIAPVNDQIKDQLVDFLGYCLEPFPGVPPPLLSPAEIAETVRIIEQVNETA